MIGQQRLLERLNNTAVEMFPRSMIVCGPERSGKHLIAKVIADKLGATLVNSDIKVDSIREVINLAYKQSEPTVYLLANADKMSIAAKNALLKVTEEPPRQAYFIITLTDLNNTLGTIRSRAQVFNLDAYTPAEIEEFARLRKPSISAEELQIVTSICTDPGQVSTILAYDIVAFYDFVQLVIENIQEVSGTNALKIGNRLKYKDDGDGWDIVLFMRAMVLAYRQVMEKSPSKTILSSINVVCDYLHQLSTTGINKQSTVDMMILELRGVGE